MAHITLLGDSIFDNQAYVGDDSDVITHFREMLPQDWKATLKAVDGSMVENVSRQLFDSLPDTTHFVICVGGNNAIMNADILGLKVNSSVEVFNTLSNRVSDFEFQYNQMLKTVLSHNLPTTVCTIYYPQFADASVQKISVAALSAFNDVIIRQAILGNLPILDLRLVCNEADDYANEIEPSGKGGRKIASKILEVIQNHDFSSGRMSIYF